MLLKGLGLGVPVLDPKILPDDGPLPEIANGLLIFCVFSVGAKGLLFGASVFLANILSVLEPSGLEPNMPPELPRLVGCPNRDCPGWDEEAKLNLAGPGVVVGVVDSLLDAGGNRDVDLALGVSSVDADVDFASVVVSDGSCVSISSSLADGVGTCGSLCASLRALPNPVPNKEPDDADGFSV